MVLSALHPQCQRISDTVLRFIPIESSAGSPIRILSRPNGRGRVYETEVALRPGYQMSRRETRSGRTAPHQSNTDLDPRTRRAIEEEMDIVFVGSGAYVVHSESGHRYRIDVFEGSCTCPDWQKPSSRARCKHMRRVELEIDARTVPRPDGRLPEPQSESAYVRSTVPVEELKAESEDRISGPISEFDRYGHSTDTQYWQCKDCGREAIRSDDLECDECSG